MVAAIWEKEIRTRRRKEVGRRWFCCKFQFVTGPNAEKCTAIDFVTFNTLTILRFVSMDSYSANFRARSASSRDS